MPEEKARVPRRQYTASFKEQIVQLCSVGRKCKRDIAEEYDISETCIYEWIRNYKRYGTCDRTAIRKAKMTEVERLQKEIKQLRMENDILKDVALMLNKSRGQNSDCSSKN